MTQTASWSHQMENIIKPTAFDHIFVPRLSMFTHNSPKSIKITPIPQNTYKIHIIPPESPSCWLRNQPKSLPNEPKKHLRCRAEVAHAHHTHNAPDGPKTFTELVYPLVIYVGKHINMVNPIVMPLYTYIIYIYIYTYIYLYLFMFICILIFIFICLLYLYVYIILIVNGW